MKISKFKEMESYLADKNNSKVYLVQDIPVDRESGQPKYNVWVHKSMAKLRSCFRQKLK